MPQRFPFVLDTTESVLEELSAVLWVLAFVISLCSEKRVNVFRYEAVASL